jgi:hypothetical protein
VYDQLYLILRSGKRDLYGSGKLWQQHAPHVIDWSYLCNVWYSHSFKTHEALWILYIIVFHWHAYRDYSITYQSSYITFQCCLPRFSCPLPRERELSSKAHAISSERTVVVKSSIYLEDDIVCRVFVTQALQGPFRSPHGFPSSRSLRETRQCIIIDPQERKASGEHVMSQNHQYYGPSGIHPFLEPVCKCKC